MIEQLRIAAHAKVNLFLRILSREANGYHGLETAFALLELADELAVSRIATGIELTVDGAETGPEEENLAYRAAAMVLQATGARFGVRMRLTKRIPVGAGLGGGSSDAAAALHAVNALADGAVPRHELLQFAARLGADVPFFASGAPLALAWNHGERLYRLRPLRSAPVLLAVPDRPIASAEAYGWYDAANPEPPRRGSVVLEAEAFDSWGGFGRLAGNDFESVVFGRYPELKGLFERLAETRPLLARLTGSGACLFAVYRSDGDRDLAAETLGSQHARLVSTATRGAAAPGPEPLGA